MITRKDLRLGGDEEVYEERGIGPLHIGLVNRISGTSLTPSSMITRKDLRLGGDNEVLAERGIGPLNIG